MTVEERTGTREDVAEERTEARGDVAEECRVSVVLPTYNERGNLDALLAELDEVFDRPSMASYRPVEYVFVDGGSTDGTREWLREQSRSHERVCALLLRRRFGQSAALGAGFEHAHGDLVVSMDADGQNDPADVPALLDRLDDDYDCVSGWRRNRKDPWHKTIPSRIQTPLAKATGPSIHDFGCTLKAYRAEAVDDLDLYGEGHRYIPAKLFERGHTIDEVEVNHRPREYGRSRYGASRLLRGFLDLVFHAFWNRYATRPFQLFGTVAVVLFVVGGVLLAGGLLAFALGWSAVPVWVPLLIAVQCWVLGGGVVLAGLVSEMLAKLYYRDDPAYRVEELLGR